MAFVKPDKDTPSFAEFRKMRRNPFGDQPARTAAVDPADARNDAADPAKPVAAPKPSGEAPSPPEAAGPAENVTLKAWVHYPATGHSEIFDRAAAAYGDRMALRLLLKVALTAYEDALRAGAITAPLADYPKAGGGVSVSRRMRPDAFRQAKAILDPLAMMPPGTLAARICRNALACHFKDI